MSIPLDEIVSVLSTHLKDPAQVRAITEELKAVEAEAKESRASASAKRTKTKQVVLIRGEASLKPLVAGGAWIVAVPEDDQTATLQDRIRTSARAYNDGLRKDRATRLVKTFARALEWVKGKVIKQACGSHPYQVRTRLPVEVQVVENPDL